MKTILQRLTSDIRPLLSELADILGQLWRMDYGADTFANAAAQLMTMLPTHQSPATSN